MWSSKSPDYPELNTNPGSDWAVGNSKQANPAGIKLTQE